MSGAFSYQIRVQRYNIFLNYARKGAKIVVLNVKIVAVMCKN